MICVALLQDSVDDVEGETVSNSETGVTCDVEATVEVCIKVEEARHISDEIPEAVTSPPIKTEQEVRLWGVCVCMCVRCWQLMLLGHLWPPPKKETVKLHLTISCFVLYCGCHLAF